MANALYPVFDDDNEDDDEATALWRDRRAINVTQLERLDEVWAGPLAEIPLIREYYEQYGMRLPAALSEELDALEKRLSAAKA